MADLSGQGVVLDDKDDVRPGFLLRTDQLPAPRPADHPWVTVLLAPDVDHGDDLPPLNGSALLDPWRIRARRARAGTLEPHELTGPTLGERILWDALNGLGSGWRREYSTGRYRLDFYLESARLAVEVDGSSHRGIKAMDHDAVRDEWHLARGIDTCRIDNDDVLRDLDGVLEIIEERLRLQAPSEAVLTIVGEEEPVPAGPITSEALESAQARAEAEIEGFAKAACIDVLPQQRSRAGLRASLERRWR